VFPFVRSSIIYLITPRIQKTFIIKGLERAVASRRMQSKRNKRRIKNIRKQKKKGKKKSCQKLK
jgi:hypothetical protein